LLDLLFQADGHRRGHGNAPMCSDVYNVAHKSESRNETEQKKMTCPEHLQVIDSIGGPPWSRTRHQRIMRRIVYFFRFRNKYLKTENASV